MSNSDNRKKDGNGPSWQIKSPENTTTKEEKSTTEPPTREPVIEQAKRFLEEEEVRNATTNKKIEFLEGKGLRREEIQKLLGISRNAEATATSKVHLPFPFLFLKHAKLSQSAEPPQSTSNSPRESAQTAPTSTTAPLIITYPEFLTTPRSPAPLVTKSRLFTTLYIFSGLCTLIYGTNKYLLTPMLQSLTDSRLSLHSTASSNLQRLIQKLEENVSEIPVAKHPESKEHMGNAEEEESDTDPTELFHRDIGVQTSPPSSPSSPPSSTPLVEHTTRLSAISKHLKSVLEESVSEGEDAEDLRATINILKEYLEGMLWNAPNNYMYSTSGYNTFGAVSQGTESDEIARLKQSIRGVKGLLLSARSFPGGYGYGGGTPK
ncbi:hypothetical protein B7494_g6005 [Chlorociboria aeruginascens]|nr:hypothetical protein B7494_g6005 [Chlorociboria aeruginascens]